MAAADPVVDAIVRLRLAGWLCGDTAAPRFGGGVVWVVSGRNGTHLLQAAAPTQAGAWRAAVEQARSLGLLDVPGPAGVG
jgi:hypothetical protein